MSDNYRLLRHTYITNLIHAGVDSKTVPHLAAHKNSKVSIDIYAKAKYNNTNIVDIALKPQNDRDESRASPK